MFDELKEVKWFNEITDFRSLVMLNTLKKQNVYRVFKKQKHI